VVQHSVKIKSIEVCDESVWLMFDC
jgi:hypothetical protein